MLDLYDGLGGLLALACLPFRRRRGKWWE